MTLIVVLLNNPNSFSKFNSRKRKSSWACFAADYGWQQAHHWCLTKIFFVFYVLVKSSLLYCMLFHFLALLIKI